MNPNNYASLEASQRLISAGIVLKTDAQWVYHVKPGVWSGGTWELSKAMLTSNPYLPAPSMAEVWRKLPTGININKMFYNPRIEKGDNLVYVGYYWFDSPIYTAENLNPTDALIDLLIWARKEKI